MDILSRGLESIKRLWAALSGPQKLTLSVAAAVMVALLMWGSAAGAGDAWQKVVGAEVDDAQRAEVLKSLAKKNVLYEVRGPDILVRKTEADRVVMELAGDGALSNQAMWEWLKSSDVFATKWDKEKRYQIALQRKLEYMIRGIDGVRNASVQITGASEAQQLGFQGPGASASVQVELKPNAALSKPHVAAIVGLVAHAVPGLDRDRVHLADTQGRPYRIPKADGGFGGASLLEIEADLEDRVKGKITDLFPSARVVIRAFARAKSETTDATKYDARPVATFTKERKVVKKPSAAGGSGPAKGEEALAPAAAPSQENETEIEEHAVVGQTKTHLVDPAGQIERITVGVLLPVLADAAGKPVGKSPPLEEIRKLAVAASGAKPEDVSVVALETRAPEPIAAVPAAERAFEWLAANWSKIAIAALAFLALVLVARAIRGALPAGEIEEIRAITSRLGESLAAPGERAAGPLAPGGDLAAVRQNIRDVVQRSPAEAASTLKSWVAGD